MTTKKMTYIFAYLFFFFCVIHIRKENYCPFIDANSLLALCRRRAMHKNPIAFFSNMLTLYRMNGILFALLYCYLFLYLSFSWAFSLDLSKWRKSLKGKIYRTSRSLYFPPYSSWTFYTTFFKKVKTIHRAFIWFYNIF